jgi:hypothetical protein|uniref:Uncharacterized protein n=1 Tax=viral metagenome TaxID=1070528 RepID=A0A6C0CX58_9ZZZZ
MASNSTESNSTTVDLTLSPEQINLVDVVKEEALNLLKEKIISEIGDKPVDKQLLMKLLVIGMENIEKTKVKGKDQKDIVKEALIQVIKLESIKVPQEEGLIKFLENDLDDVIDLVVDASKGKIDINKAEKQAVSLVKCIFTCLKKNEQK